MRARPRTRRVAVVLAVSLGLVLSSCSGDESASPTGTTAPPPPPESTTTTEAPLDAGEKRFVYTPEVGDCFDERSLEDEDEAGRAEQIVLLLDCTLPHQFEVFHLVEYEPPAPDPGLVPEALPDEGGDAPETTTTTAPPRPGTPPSDPSVWPGDEVLESFAKLHCPKGFLAYVGQEYELSSLDIAWRYPDASDWSRDRTVICLLEHPDGERFGSPQRGSGN